ncbi:MAG: hypothetical protein ABIA04_09595 [Pseudomonadota bacterium]
MSLEYVHRMVEKIEDSETKIWRGTDDFNNNAKNSLLAALVFKSPFSNSFFRKIETMTYSGAVVVH